MSEHVKRFLDAELQQCYEKHYEECPSLLVCFRPTFQPFRCTRVLIL